MLLLLRQAVARDSQGVGDQGLVLLDGFVYGQGGRHVLHDGADADRQGAGSHLTVHHGIDKLLFTALRIFLLQRQHLDPMIAEIIDGCIHRCDGLGLVFLDTDDGTGIAEHLLHDGDTDNDFLAPLEHDAVVAGQVRLTLRAVDDQALRLGTTGRIEFDVGRESRAAETYDAAGPDAVQDGIRVFGNFGVKFVAPVDALLPLITFDRNLDMGDRVAGDVLAGTDRLDRAGNGTVDKGGDESARLREDGADLDLVTDGDYGFGRSAQMLGHGNINGRGQRKHLNGALAGDLAVVRMDAADGECRQFSHCFPPFSVQRSGERPVQARRPVSEPEPLSAAGASGS